MDQSSRLITRRLPDPAGCARPSGPNIASSSVNIANNGPGNTVGKANDVYGALSCTANNPLPTNAGQSNSAASKTGPCTSL